MNMPTAGTNPQVVSDAVELRRILRDLRLASRTVGLVPTMGALHEGHISLVRQSISQCDFTVVTIFVNPTQFGPHEDFSRYPRTWDSDLEQLRQAQANLVFAPAVETMYPEGFSTTVRPPAVAGPWEGECRPGHFEGVTTVVMKLFQLVPADVAFFGQKDYQQSRVIQDMVRDLNVPIQIEICPTVREPNGLAMSSRNQYLSAEERHRSLSLHRALCRASELAEQGERDASILGTEMRTILTSGGVDDIDYAALVDPESLQPVQEVNGDTMALIAARVGTTRLIDNRRLGDR
jgi:pantoate--beta-alanine ligase